MKSIFAILHLNASNFQDSSRNGTYYREARATTELKLDFLNFTRIDDKIKRRILAHKDSIVIEKVPTIAFEFQSLQLTTNNLPDDINKAYHIGNELGRGGCGVVYFAQDRRTCQPFALKYSKSENDENSVQTIIREVDILTRLKHPCILELFDTKSYIDSVAIFLDFMKGGDLLSRIQTSGHFSESLTKFVFYQICCGVEYLHSQNVTHRDLKPENILLATTDQYTLVKVSDFGLSKRVNTNSVLQTQCGTPMYLAPEVRSAHYTNKVDIWSLGVILYNCLTSQYPFHGSHHDYKLTLNNKRFEQTSDEGQRIVRATLRMNAQDRPSAHDLLTTQWLSKSDESVLRACEIMKDSKLSKKTK